MTTKAGCRHVDWLVQAKIPTYSGELYRSNFEASVRAIESEAVRDALTDLRAAVVGLRTAAGMPWPARCIEGDLVTEDPDAYECDDAEMLSDRQRCVTGGGHRWADYCAVVLDAINKRMTR